MEKIPTANKLIRKKDTMILDTNKFAKVEYVSYKDTRELMVEFAKLHVEAALYIASERADLTDNGRFPYVDKASILNSYPLSNIK